MTLYRDNRLEFVDLYTNELMLILYIPRGTLMIVRPTKDKIKIKENE